MLRVFSQPGLKASMFQGVHGRLLQTHKPACRLVANRCLPARTITSIHHGNSCLAGVGNRTSRHVSLGAAEGCDLSRGTENHDCAPSRRSRRCRRVRIIYFSTMFLDSPNRSAISAWVRPSIFCQTNTLRQLIGNSVRACSMESANWIACMKCSGSPDDDTL